MKESVYKSYDELPLFLNETSSFKYFVRSILCILFGIYVTL